MANTGYCKQDLVLIACVLSGRRTFFQVLSLLLTLMDYDQQSDPGVLGMIVSNSLRTETLWA